MFLCGFVYVNVGCLKVKLHDSLFWQFNTDFLVKMKAMGSEVFNGVAKDPFGIRRE